MSTTQSSTFQPAYNPELLVELSDAELFKAFRAGATLHVWRNSSPHNWWLTVPTACGTRELSRKHQSHPGPAFLKFGRVVDVTSQRVTYGGHLRASDEDLPVGQSWDFDADKFEAATARWSHAVRCAEQFNALVGSVEFDLSHLQQADLALARTLKRKRHLPMTLDMRASAEHLLELGLACVNPAGYLTCTPLMGMTPIPREPSLQA